MEKRKCIFCGAEGLTREHIYSKWIFNHLVMDDKTFKPATYSLNISDKNFKSDTISEDISDGREIIFQDFTIKQICGNCNNGWMSEVEKKVETIYRRLSSKTLTIDKISVDEALILSQWSIIKVLLIATASQTKTLFNKMTFNLLRKGYIPEGFIVEIAAMEKVKLDFSIGGPIVRRSFDISREELDLGVMNYFIGSIQMGVFAFRISFLRTEIPIFRTQIGRKLMVLYPFKTPIPFQEINVDEYDKSKNLELKLLNTQLAIVD